MKRHWIIYLLTGLAFGAFDFAYLGFLYEYPWAAVLGDSAAADWLVFLVLNLGLWLVPVVPVALFEARASRSRLRSAVAGLVVWCAAIVAYYLTNAAYLAFWGLPSWPELHISNRYSDHYWENWASVFQGSILGGIMEWIVVAIIGGALAGFVTSTVYLRAFASTSTGAGLKIRRDP